MKHTIEQYQEALNSMVEGTSCEYFNEKAKLPESENPIFIIQELIDKQKPKKLVFGKVDVVMTPTITNTYEGPVCPTCKGNNIQTGYMDDWGDYTDIEFAYCHSCGQALDWSEE